MGILPFFLNKAYHIYLYLLYEEIIGGLSGRLNVFVLASNNQHRSSTKIFVEPFWWIYHQLNEAVYIFQQPINQRVRLSQHLCKNIAKCPAWLHKSFLRNPFCPSSCVLTISLLILILEVCYSFLSQIKLLLQVDFVSSLLYLEFHYSFLLHVFAEYSSVLQKLNNLLILISWFIRFHWSFRIS